jgi:hypothetical protein
MIDDHPDPCDSCGRMSWILICDSSRTNPKNGLALYFCPDCCDIVGHQPPFTDQELSFMKLDLEGIH